VNTLISALAAVVRFVAFGLALGAALIVIAAQGGRFSDRLDVLTHFTPIWLCLGAAALVIWVIGGGRRLASPTPILGGVAILGAALLMAPELSRPEPGPPPTDGETIKVVQFNLWGRAGRPDGMLEWILAQDADILVLEEAFARSGGVTKALRKQYPYQTTCADPRPCSTVILSRLEPIRETGLQRQPVMLSGALATYRTARGPFTVIGVHYTWPIPAGPQQQMTRRLAEVVDTLPSGSTIVAGDFNSTPWSFSLRRQDRRLGLERRTKALASWPAAAFTRYRIASPFPLLPIDHLYAGADWKTVSVKRGPALGSDHYPVVVTLRR